MVACDLLYGWVRYGCSMAYLELVGGVMVNCCGCSVFSGCCVSVWFEICMFGVLRFCVV